MLHITNGDIAAAALRRGGLPGQVAMSADLLHEGPCPTDASPAEWRETRARYLADAGYATYHAALEQLVEWDAALHAARGEDEVVLWFEHDLFDQLQLVRLTAWLASQEPRAARLSLICVGDYPGISRFKGLGQLSPARLAGLFPERAPVTEPQAALATDAWRRLGGSTPRELAALLRQDTSALPYLDGAIRRLLQELPWTRDGLSRSEHQALAAIAGGASTVGAAFRAAQEMEERVFMGDLSFDAVVRELGEAAQPLVRLSAVGDTPVPDQPVALTPLGTQVLGGRADHVRVNGVDRWVGGVHLQGRGRVWRWDAGADEVMED